MSSAIALDGPAGAGKSTIARRIASRLGILYLDTGAMYRAIGLKALISHVPMTDPSAMAHMLENTELDIRFVDGQQQVWLDGSDVTQDIRTPAVSRAASDVSALPVVRLRLVEIQRQIAHRQALIMDGRDIGTYVLPDAPYKFFLTASLDERAGRRLRELHSRDDQTATFTDVRNEIAWRDQQDSGRAFAPLRQAEDAILIDTTNLTIEEVVEVILQCLGKQNHE